MTFLKPKKSKTDIPGDLGIKFGSKEEAYWTQIKEKTLAEIETLEKMLKFNKAILDMVIRKILEEKDFQDKTK